MAHESWEEKRKWEVGNGGNWELGSGELESGKKKSGKLRVRGQCATVPGPAPVKDFVQLKAQ
jgi:hypothetical protein